MEKNYNKFDSAKYDEYANQVIDKMSKVSSDVKKTMSELEKKNSSEIKKLYEYCVSSKKKLKIPRR